MKPALLIQIKARVGEARKNTLVMNALYLMISTFILGASGFIFWVVVTKMYSAAAVGLATTLLSVSGLLSLLGLAGFDTTFVRFLPGSDRKNDYINSGLIVSAGIGTILAIALGFTLPLVLPSLSIVSNPWAFLSFVFFTVVTSLNILTNAVFLAYKQARYILIINALFSIVKIVLPLLVVDGGAVVIFTIAGVAQLCGLVLSIAWMRRIFNYKISLRIHMDMLRIVRKFSFSIYVSNILSLLPPTLLPLIILYYLGAKNAAYYYMAFTIANVLYIIVYATMQSVLAEGSHNSAALRLHVLSAAKLITLLLLPTVLLAVLLGSYLLTIFGAEYAKNAGTLLQLLAVGALPIAAYATLTTIFKVIKKLSIVVIMNAVSALITLSLANWWLPRFGLEAVGWAWIIGNVVACIAGGIFLIKRKGRG
jgi:O-antigen/teichoic acid export membrane protein